MTRVAVLSGIAIIMTVGVYGLVAGIVKLDDLGLWLNRRAGAPARALGAGILRLAPWLMKFLSVAGMAAMFLVGGGILVHGIPPLHHAVGQVAASVGAVGGLLVEMTLNGVAGIIAGALVLALVALYSRLKGRDHRVESHAGQ